MLKQSGRLRKSFAIACAILFASLASCARIPVKDGEWCGDKGRLGAECFHSLSDRERKLDKETWDYIRFGMVCTKAENFANWKASLLKFCKYTLMCTKEEVALVEALGKRIDSFKQRASNVGSAAD